MVLNLLLACLATNILVNVDGQIEHVQVPTFMPRRHLSVKPTLRYRYLYWALSILTLLFVMGKDRGETVVEHPWFVLASLCLLAYAPFWMTKAVLWYEEQVQEAEIAAMDKQAMRHLN